MRDTNILTDNGINVQQSLELFGDMEMYDETLGDFLDMSDEKITTLEEYKNANDMPNYAIAVHALKSDARYLGFATLADLAYESEMKSKAGDSVFVQENHPKILVEAKRVINLSQQYMGRELTEVIPAGAMATTAPVQPEVQAQSPIAQEVPMQQEAQVVYQQEVAPVEQPVAAPAPMYAEQPVMSQPAAAPVDQVAYQQPAAVASVEQPVAAPAPMYAEQPVMSQPVAAPIDQAVYQQPAAVASVEQPVAVPAPMYAEQPVMSQPVAAPIDQAVYQQPAAVAPVETQPAEQKETIQFFPVDDYQKQDIMSQALYMQQQQAQIAPQVAAVKKGIILVVDDSPLVANFVKKIFSASYDVIIANDGQKAIETINDENIRSKIKTCLLDLNMPNVSGFDVMDHFREKGFFVRTPVAVISGAEDEETLDKVKGYPIVDILAKPFNERDVQRVVEKCLAVYF